MKEKRTFKKLLSMFLSFVMVVSLITVTDFTDGKNGAEDVHAATVPTDHTTMGGNPLPYEATEVIKNGNFTNETSTATYFQTASNCTMNEKMAHINVSGTDDYLATKTITCKADTTYRISYYINITEATSLKYNMFIGGVTPTSFWKDFVMPTNITNKTDGWQLVDITWECPTAGTYYMGFRNYDTNGSAQIYIDDVVMYEVNSEYLKLEWQSTSETEWKFKTSAFKGFSQYHTISKITIDGTEYENTAFLGISNGVATIYNNTLSEAPTKSLYISKGTKLIGREPEPWSDTNNTGNDFILENDVYVENIDGVWQVAEWYPPDHTNMTGGGNSVPDGATNLLTDGDFSETGNFYVTENGVKNENNTFSKKMGYVYATGTDDYLARWSVPVKAGVTYKISYYIYIADANSVVYNMESDGASDWKGSLLSSDITANTNGWEKVEFTWTATNDGNSRFIFRNYNNYGSAKIWIDDVVMYDVSKVIKDHTSLGGNPVPAGKVNMITNGTFDEKIPATNYIGNCKVADGMLCIDATGTDDYMQIYDGIDVVKGHQYVISYYVNICNSNEKLLFRNFAGGTGVNGGWEEPITGSQAMTSNTNGWEKVEFTWTASNTGSFQPGMHLADKDGAGNIYIDDFVMYDVTVPTNKTSVDLTYTSIEGDNQIQFTAANNIMPQLEDGWNDGTAKVIINGKEVTTTMGVNKYVASNPLRYMVLYGSSIADLIGTKNISINKQSFTISFTTSSCIEEITFNITENLNIEKLGTVWGKYSNEHNYPDGNNVSYYNIDNGTSYVITSFNNAVEVKKDGTIIEAVAGTTLTDVGTYDITSIENDEKFVKKVVLYKNGDADASGNVDICDLVSMKRESENKGCNLAYAADLNRSDKVDSVDLNAMRRALAMGNANTAFVQPKGNSILNGVMPIGGMTGPSYYSGNANKFVNSTVWNAFKDMGINNIGYDSNDFSDDNIKSVAHENMKLAEERGIGIYVTDGDCIGGETFQIAGKEKMLKYIGNYSGYKSFLGMSIVDEPSTDSYQSSGSKKLSNYAPAMSMFNNYANIHGYVSMYPLVSGADNTTYENYMKEVEASGAEILSYDNYPVKIKKKNYYNAVTGSWFERDGIKYDLFYNNLVVARKLSLEKNKPFHTYAQVGFYDDNGYTKNIIDNFMMTTEELQWQVSASLAFGSKGVQYYPLVQSDIYAKGDGDTGNMGVSGLIKADGTVNTRYSGAVTDANNFIKKVDEVLMNCTNKGVIANDSNASSYVTSLTSYNELTGVTGANALVGCFDYYGKTALLVVNCNLTSAQDITLSFNKSCTGKVTKFDTTTSDVSGNSLTLNVGAGQCSLVVLD